MSLQPISTFNRHIKFHFTGHGTQILWWSQSSHINPLYMWLLYSDHRITVAQLLLYYDHMVQVEHNRTIQQYNICINITQASFNTHCNYMYCTFPLTTITTSHQLTHNSHTKLPQYQQHKINIFCNNLSLLSLTHNHSYQTAAQLCSIKHFTIQTLSYTTK